MEWSFTINTNAPETTVRLKWEPSSLKMLSNCKVIDGRKTYAANNSAYMTDGINILMDTTSKTLIWRCSSI